MNGVALTSAHPAILLQHIEEPPPRFAQKTMPRPYGGTFLTSNVIERREVNLIFAIRERFDYAARMDALQAVSAWAALKTVWAGLTRRLHGWRMNPLSCGRRPPLGQRPRQPGAVLIRQGYCLTRCQMPLCR